MEETRGVRRSRSWTAGPSSPLWTGGIGLTAGLLGVSVAVQSSLAGSGRELAGSVTLLVLLAVHARFVLGLLTGGSPGWWAAGLQSWLTYLPLPLFGAAWTPVCGLLAGALLLAADRIRSFVLVALALVTGPLLLAAPDQASVDLGWAVSAPVVGLAEFAVVSLAVRAHRLSEARTEMIGKAVSFERRRFTRDLHDLVGHRLTVLVLKVQLIQRLLRDDLDKCENEVHETLALARGLAADVRAVAHGVRRSSLERELSSARALLESVGVRCQVKVSCRELPWEVAEALTHALREGVTNVLRHATARECVVHLLERDGLVRLSIRNDGVGPPRKPGDAGQGLLNLAERVSVLGGWLEATALRSGEFTFTVYLPRAL
ncbi:sensor histidine kinase [Nonomuraea ceibae]|uniref:sensor histidine kinase n=1 Tax=Nonomuraea ceibae TaxID=1935170 RepID=UPI001C604377|nr:histidine kinase [Nonomuraea ceibae]